MYIYIYIYIYIPVIIIYHYTCTCISTVNIGYIFIYGWGPTSGLWHTFMEDKLRLAVVNSPIPRVIPPCCGIGTYLVAVIGVCIHSTVDNLFLHIQKADKFTQYCQDIESAATAVAFTIVDITWTKSNASCVFWGPSTSSVL